MDVEEQPQTHLKTNEDSVGYTQRKAPWIDPETGQPLDTKQVEKGMQRERQCFKKFKVQEEVPYSEHEKAPRRRGWEIIRVGEFL